MENKTMQYRKWHCPDGDKLWADLDTDAARIEFLESGQAINTGIIAPSMIAEIVSVFRRAETAESDLAEAQEALANIDLPGMNALADMGLPEYCTLQKENAALKKRIEESHDCAACPERACEWEEHEGMWRPGCCGETWEFTDGGPRENAVTHCMFCGGLMIFATEGGDSNAD